MDQKFDDFMESKDLSPTSKKQYSLYFDKAEILYENGMLDQDRVNQFIATYKSSLVKSFLKIYFEYKGIKDLVIHKRTGRPSRKKPVIMSQEDADLLFATLYEYSERFGLMAELSFACALRRDEVCNISVGDVDWNEWQKEKKTGKLLIAKAKGDKQRYVIIPTYLMEKLKDYVNKHDVFPTDKLFFKSNSHKEIPISKERYWEIFHEAVVELFGKKYKLHTLRHSKATQWFREGIDIVRIQQRLGHSDISTTRLYINPDEENELKRWQGEQ